MFSNIGNKIRVLAKVICIIGIVFGAICGLVVMIIGFTMLGSRYTSGAGVGLIFAGIIIAALGALYSWISSFVLYGYGQLIHSTQNIEKKVLGSDYEGFDSAPAAPAAPAAPTYNAYGSQQSSSSSYGAQQSSTSYGGQQSSSYASNVCPYCGAVNTDDSRFCVTCGKPIK